MTGDQFQGGCHCGAVRYRLNRAPMFVNCCHCTDCQTQTGGAFVINGLIETAEVIILQGAPVAAAMPTSSGRPHDVYRCATCGTAVWSDYGRRPALRFVRLSTLDDKTRFTPDAHIFVRSKQPWVVLPADVRAFDIFYDMKTEWTPESLARREAILGPLK